jgi:DNA-binding transcriptional LysR family regulator
MRRDSLADLTVFAAIAQHLSFKVAASQLGVTPSALSHSMRLLEERLGMRLLNRTTRSVALTDAGQRLLERLRPAMDQIADALEDLNQERTRPFGRLRLHAIHMAAVAVMTPIWHRFLSAYPDVQLELNVGEAPIGRTRSQGLARRNRTAGCGAGARPGRLYDRSLPRRRTPFRNSGRSGFRSRSVGASLDPVARAVQAERYRRRLPTHAPAQLMDFGSDAILLA